MNYKMGTKKFNEHRLRVVKTRYGQDAFRKFGSMGGNRMLKDHALVKAYREGRIRIIK